MGEASYLGYSNLWQVDTKTNPLKGYFHNAKLRLTRCIVQSELCLFRALQSKTKASKQQQKPNSWVESFVPNLIACRDGASGNNGDIAKMEPHRWS